jgi:thiamine biosynthesis protein ThiC
VHAFGTVHAAFGINACILELCTHMHTHKYHACILRTMRRQIETIYQQHHLMEPSAQELLFDQPEDHVRQQLTTTSIWLSHHTTLFKESIRRAKAQAAECLLYTDILPACWRGIGNSGNVVLLRLPTPG